MKKLLPLLFLLGCSEHLLYQPRLTDYEYQQMQSKTFPWYNSHIFNIVYRETTHLKFKNPAFFVMCIIDAETGGTGNRKARGPKVRVRYGKKYITTRAIGLMQVIPEFWVKKADRHRLTETEVNVHYGVKALTMMHKLAKGDLRKTLKNYNSGPGSKYYNKKYIDHILGRYYGT